MRERLFKSRRPLPQTRLEQVFHIGLAHLGVDGAGDGDAAAGRGEQLTLAHLGHPAEVHQIRAVYLVKAGPGEECVLVVGQTAVDLAGAAVRHVEIEGLGHDLHRLQRAEGHAEHAPLSVDAQGGGRLAQDVHDLIQNGEEPLLGGGLQQIVGRVDGIALHGELRRGGEEHDLHALVFLPELPGRLDAVHPRHQHVQQDQVVLLAVHGGEQLHAALEALTAQLQPALLPVGRKAIQHPQHLLAVVVTDSNPHHGTPFTSYR